MELQDNVPMPPVGGPTLKWPFGQMEVGQSFSVTLENRERCRSAAGSYQRQHPGVKFTVQVDPENPEGWRCWRLS